MSAIPSLPSTPPSALAHLHLQPHPEGGWFKETYRASVDVATDRGPRAVSTAILYALADNDFSAVHRIKSDECWFHHAGAPLLIRTWHDDGKVVDHHLGPVTDTSCLPQVTIPAGAWFAARLVTPQDWSLVSCTVAPGFDFIDFQMATVTDLADWPQETWASFVRGES